MCSCGQLQLAVNVAMTDRYQSTLSMMLTLILQAPEGDAPARDRVQRELDLRNSATNAQQLQEASALLCTTHDVR